MKLLHYTKCTAKVFALIMLAQITLTACAGGDAEMEEPINGENSNSEDEAGLNENSNNASNENLNNNNANNNANNSEGNLDNEGGNNLLNNTGLSNNPSNSAKANEFVNNAAGENFLNDEKTGNAAAAGLDAPADLAVEQNSTQDLGIAPSDGIVSPNQDAGANAAIVAPNTNMGAIDTSLAPSAGAPTAPRSGGTVHYISKNGTSAYDKPNGQVVKNYEQGDHPLVNSEGEWSRTSDGAYVPASSLTSRPVPRAKTKKSWQ